MYIGRVRGWAGTGCGGVESTVGRTGPGGALGGAVGGIQSHCPGEGAQQGRRGAQAADQRTDGGTHYSPRGAAAFALESQACLLQCIFFRPEESHTWALFLRTQVFPPKKLNVISCPRGEPEAKALRVDKRWSQWS